eukprot:Pgem_evm1s12921
MAFLLNELKNKFMPKVYREDAIEKEKKEKKKQQILQQFENLESELIATEKTYVE